MTGRSTIDPDTLRRRYEVDGATVDVIAAEMRRDRRAIYDALHRDGIALRGRHDLRSWGDVLTVDYLSWCRSQGWSDYRIGVEVGCDGATVAEWLAVHGLSDRFSRSERARARRVYEAGATIPEVAERFGVGRRTARRLLLEAGVTLRPPGRRKRQ